MTLRVFEPISRTIMAGPCSYAIGIVSLLEAKSRYSCWIFCIPVLLLVGGITFYLVARDPTPSVIGGEGQV